MALISRVSFTSLQRIPFGRCTAPVISLTRQVSKSAVLRTTAVTPKSDQLGEVTHQVKPAESKEFDDGYPHHDYPRTGILFRHQIFTYLYPCFEGPIHTVVLISAMACTLYLLLAYDDPPRKKLYTMLVITALLIPF